jgi:hypothetical protein
LCELVLGYCCAYEYVLFSERKKRTVERPTGSVRRSTWLRDVYWKIMRSLQDYRTRMCINFDFANAVQEAARRGDNVCLCKSVWPGNGARSGSGRVLRAVLRSADRVSARGQKATPTIVIRPQDDHVRCLSYLSRGISEAKFYGVRDVAAQQRDTTRC